MSSTQEKKQVAGDIRLHYISIKDRETVFSSTNGVFDYFTMTWYPNNYRLEDMV